MTLVPAVALPFLNELVALFVVCVAIAYLSYRLRLVPIAGFLIAGVVIGPNALALIDDQELVNILAEIGVILLLFSIGLEFSLEKLTRIRRAIFVGGGVQVLLSVGVVFAISLALGASWQTSVYTGCLVALSSTAIVLGLLSERSETDSMGGRLSLAFLIFQDLAIVFMVLLVPILAGGSGTLADLLVVLGKAALLIAAVVVLARRAVPWILEQIAETRRQELFLLAVVAVCFGTAALSSLAGVSLALGAFLAGLVVSESHYRELAISEILPLRIVFNAVFFVSVGMLLDLGFVLDRPLVVLAVAGVVVVVKFATAGAGVFALGFPATIAGSTGLALAQIGEFSFVLERAGRAEGLTPAGLGEFGAQTFLAVTVLLMILTPAMVSAGPRLQDIIARLRPLRKTDGASRSAAEVKHAGLEDHVIIVGHGPAGQRLVRVLKDTQIPFIVVDVNPATIRRLRNEGVPALFGDAGRRSIIEHAGIERAKLCVIVINDPGATSRVVQTARYLNPTLQIVARTRFFSEVERLEHLGADIVIPEELETTVRIFTHVLGAYMIPPDEIERFARTLRSEDYRIFRGSIQEAHLMVLQGLDEEGLHTRAVAVRPGAPIEGRSLAELQIRSLHALTVLAVRRAHKTIGSPAGEFVLETGDRLVLIGTADRFAEAAHLFRPAGDDVTS